MTHYYNIVALLIYWCSAADATASISELCREQIEARRVPVACYQEIHRLKHLEGQRLFVTFLDQRCLLALAEESRLSYLDNLIRHPLITTTCRSSANRRRERVRYALQDAKPLEVIESLIDEGQ